jgi:hypothetical protein
MSFTASASIIGAEVDTRITCEIFAVVDGVERHAGAAVGRILREAAVSQLDGVGVHADRCEVLECRPVDVDWARGTGHDADGLVVVGPVIGLSAGGRRNIGVRVDPSSRGAPVS